jgi:nucleoside-diphosphate kinase
LERTLVLLKPDAVARRLVGRILARFEERGLSILGLKLLRLAPAQAEALYAPHRGKPFFEGLVRFATRGALVALCLEGKGAIGVVRAMLGATDAAAAAPGSIRGDFGLSHRYNLGHGSDSAESAGREIALLFREDELVRPAEGALDWLYDFSEGGTI